MNALATAEARTREPRMRFGSHARPRVSSHARLALVRASRKFARVALIIQANEKEGKANVKPKAARRFGES